MVEYQDSINSEQSNVMSVNEKVLNPTEAEGNTLSKVVMSDNEVFKNVDKILVDPKSIY